MHLCSKKPPVCVRLLMPILLFKLSVDLLNANPLFGTAIAILRTGDEIIAAADSKTVVDRYPDWKPVAIQICKIQKLEDTVYFATAGLQGDSTGTLDVVKAIRDSHKKASSVSQTVDASEVLIKSSFLEALNRQKGEHPANFKKNFSKYSIVDFVFFGIEHDATFVYTRRLRAQDADVDGLSVAVHSENCPPACKIPGEITLIGRSLAMEKYIEQLRSSGTNLSNREIVENAVATEIANSSETVSPPIDILRIDRRGAEWIKVKNECR